MTQTQSLDIEMLALCRSQGTPTLGVISTTDLFAHGEEASRFDHDKQSIAVAFDTKFGQSTNSVSFKSLLQLFAKKTTIGSVINGLRSRDWLLIVTTSPGTPSLCYARSRRSFFRVHDSDFFPLRGSISV